MRRLTRDFGWVFVVAALFVYVNIQGFKVFQEIHSNDFKHMWIGALALRIGDSPYRPETLERLQGVAGVESINPYVYPPTTGILMRPLTWMRFSNAVIVWFVLNHLLLLGSLAILIHLFPGWRNPWPILFLLVVITGPTIAYSTTSYPGYALAPSMTVSRTLKAGQLNFLLLFLFAIAWWGWRSNRAWLAGFAVALGAMIKLLPGIFGIYFLAKRSWRPLLWTAAWSLAILLASIALVGWRVHAEFIPIMREMGYGRSVWEQIEIRQGGEPYYRHPFNQSFNSLFHHMLAPDPIPNGTRPWFALGETRGKRLANALTWAVTLALVALTFGMILRGPAAPPETAPCGAPPREAVEFSLMIMLSLLIPSIMWDHYLVMLLFAQAVLIALYARLPRLPRGRIVVLIAASLLIAWPMALYHPKYAHGVGLLGMSAKLFATLVLYGLAIDALRLTSFRYKE